MYKNLCMNLLVYIFFYFSATIYVPGAILCLDNRVVNKKYRGRGERGRGRGEEGKGGKGGKGRHASHPGWWDLEHLARRELKSDFDLLVMGGPTFNFGLKYK